MDRDEERRIIAQVCAGDANAFEALVVAYQKQVYNLALRTVGSEEDAADMTQEVFLRAYRALVENFCFEQYGFTLKAAFDINPDLIGKEMHGIVVHDFSTLDDILADIQPDVAVLCVPKAMANDVANEICSVGVKAIWNFTNTELQVKDADPIIENIHFSDSLLALGYYIAESQDEAEARAAKAKKA